MAQKQAISAQRLWRRAVTGLLAALVAAALLLSPRAETTGHRIMVALPLVGLACSVASGQGLRYLGRFVLLDGTVRLTKAATGTSALGARPDGEGRGFPSSHMAAAGFGAAAAVQTCLHGMQPAQALAVLLAGYVGASRIEAQRHDARQVLAGAVLGWLMQIAALTAFDRAFARLAERLRGAVALLFSLQRRRRGA